MASEGSTRTVVARAVGGTSPPVPKPGHCSVRFLPALSTRGGTNSGGRARSWSRNAAQDPARCVATSCEPNRRVRWSFGISSSMLQSRCGRCIGPIASRSLHRRSYSVRSTPPKRATTSLPRHRGRSWLPCLHSLTLRCMSSWRTNSWTTCHSTWPGAGPIAGGRSVSVSPLTAPWSRCPLTLILFGTRRSAGWHPEP